jgi:hypothetical protein
VNPKVFGRAASFAACIFSLSIEPNEDLTDSVVCCAGYAG